MRREKQTGIDCPIHLFPKQEAEIDRLTQEINRAPTAADKVPAAQALTEAVEVLLACEAYDEENAHCQLCQQFSQLRRKTAEVVIKAGRLDERRRT